MPAIKSVAILGAGSWGTAVAVHLAKQNIPVTLWTHNKEKALHIAKENSNTVYLPGIIFPSSLCVSDHLNNTVAGADHVIMAVPSHAFASVLAQISAPLCALSWLTKGLDPSSNTLLSTVVHARWGKQCRTAIISGPSFAKEVAQGLPTALTIASKHPLLQQQLLRLFHHQHLRVYVSEDIIGAQIGGAVKNVLAIACGVSDGLGFGANAKAALITRGLAEMRRLGRALGAQDETFMGLAGLGDLVLTCTDNQSRNRRFGLAIGRGSNVDEAEKSIGQVVEGIHNAAQVCTLANQYAIDMPICKQIYLLLHGNLSITQALNNLFDRPSKDESN